MTHAATRTDSEVLTAVIGEIDRFLARTLRSRGAPGILEEAICYTVIDGGKRLRPALVLMCCEAVGGDLATALAAAAAMELVHNFSLVHDDLPSMDDDALRRGRPTLHVQAGEALATLAGDAMVSLAFELLAEAPLPPEAVVRLVGELAGATSGMIVGQVHDTLGGFPPELDREQRLRLVHRNKTGALLRAACRMGAICGGSDSASLEALERYGAALGLMFQIVDDLLDVTQSTEHIGKATGKDIPAGKLTFPSVLGVDRSREEVRRLQAEARVALGHLGPAADPLRTLSDDMAVRTK